MSDLLSPVAPFVIAALLLAGIMKLGNWLKAKAAERVSDGIGGIDTSGLPKRRRTVEPQPEQRPAPQGFGRRAEPPSGRAFAATAPPPKPGDADAMAAYWQADAKVKDDAHKAEISAHVNRDNPPLTETDLATKARAETSMLAIKHVSPPRHPQRSFSYLGGHPITPDDFDWPMVHDRKGLLERLQFMAQIDCNTLPDGPGRDLLPAAGYLYFFAPMAGNHGDAAWHFVTRYVPGRATSRWSPCDPGFVGPVVSPEDAPYVFPWMAWQDKIAIPTHYDRIEIELGWIADDAEVVAGDAGTEGAFPWEVAEQRRRESLIAFHGEPVAHSDILSPYGKPTDRLWIPHEGFPLNRHALEIMTGFLKSWLKREQVAIDERLTNLGEAVDGEDEQATVQREKFNRLKLEHQAFERQHFEAWSWAYRGPVARFSPVSDKDRAAFFALFEQIAAGQIPEAVAERTYSAERLPAVLNQWLATAAMHSAETALSEGDSMVAVPAEVAEAIRYRHSVLKGHFRETGEVAQHHMFGRGDCIQTAAEEMAEEHILLLQLRYDDPVGWSMGDNGAVQYWIRPADLAAKRFDRTVATFECH